MDDTALLRQLARGNAAALEQAIERYGAYVMAVVRNRGRGLLPAEDCEELVSDVFVILWQRAGTIAKGQLKPWLGAVARNRAAEALRQYQPTLALDTDDIIEPDALWQQLYEKQRCAVLHRALSQLSKEDREIFCRYYDLCQTTAQIAEALRLNPSTVRTRLMRGRQTLRRELCKGGMFHENDVL